MQTEAAQVNQNVRYEPDERLSPSLTLGLGFQYAALIVGGIVLTPAIIVRAAGESEIYLTWAVFAALAVSGFTTVIQAIRVGRIGAGYPLLMGTSGAFIAVSVTALAEGGPAMLATPCRALIAVPVRAFGASRPVPAAYYAGRGRYRHHVDLRHHHADYL